MMFHCGCHLPALACPLSRILEHVTSRNVAADFCDMEFFVLLVKQLQEAGISVAIASFGLYNVIQVGGCACV